MSCGNHHETDCTQVLAALHAFLDGEASAADCTVIKVHLDECGPCLAEYDIDKIVKSVVARSCGCEAVSEELRVRITAGIRSVAIQRTQITVTVVPD